MAKSQRLQCRADEDFDEQVTKFQRDRGFEEKSEAVEQLIRVGLRESRSPVLYRFKDRVVRWAGDLAVFGILAGLIGFATPVLSVRDGTILAVGLLITGVGLLAVVEIARVLGGTNAAGDSLRRVLSRGSGGDDS